MNQVLNKIRELIEYLNYHTKCYDEGYPEISDTEWDRHYFELQSLENEYSIYFNDSPTQSISYEIVNSLEKAVHNHDMLSLEKTKALEEIKGFLGNAPYLAMCKMDGLTCSLKYENGVLVSAETRGNGKVGENILHNAKILPSIPAKIPYTGTLIVDGEILCSKKDFEEFANEYANPRNFAAGSIRLLDANECSKRKLQFIAWDVIEGFEDGELLSDKLASLKDCGFIIVPYIKAKSASDNMLNEISELIPSLANEMSYPIDGIVFKFDNVEYGRSLGQTSHHFRNAMAFKFEDETYWTRLLDIEWTMGRTGVLTPVAIFEPIDIDGSIVERASLHNCNIMFELFGSIGPYKYMDIEIYKANMIIPQVKSVKHSEILLHKYKIYEPTTCPVCGGEVIHKSTIDSVILACTNPDCPGKLINRLDHFCGKKGLYIKGLSKATLEKLIDWGWVSNNTDLFKLKEHRDEWVKRPGFGVKSVDKVLDAIEAGRECELSAFIASLGIPLIGSTASKELVKIFPDWDSFINAVESGYHFWDIPNFGFEMHSAITKFDYTEAKDLYNNYLTIKVNQPQSEENNNLNGMNFVVTGKVVHFKNRDELKTAIEARGGKVTGSISSKTSYLVNNDVNSTSSKNVSAKKLGVPIISEDALLEMLGLS